ncbi:MAG: hypothetical protein Q9169_006614 [Polycauliona sp. 2 TL-2023]
MSIEIWIDAVSATPQESFASCFCNPEDNKENILDLPAAKTRKRSRLSTPMDDCHQDVEITPRPNKKRRQDHPDIDPPEILSSVSSRSGDDLESHHSGRVSPTKQLGFLEDSSEPVRYHDFATRAAQMPDDVLALCDAVQALADGVAILGFQPDNLIKRLTTGTMVPLAKVQDLVTTAILREDGRAHETDWNEDVHKTVLVAALASSLHAEQLGIANVKSATIDPPDLAYQKLPKRVIDYAIVIRPTRTIQSAWATLQTVGSAGLKSWNHTTKNDVRSTPIASSIETKAPYKSWTDGKAQIAIWSAALFRRLALLQQPGQGPLEVPAMPLLIAQGHDWHFFIVSQQMDPVSKERATIIWQKIDIGGTRSCFDTYKLIAVLHWVMEWATKVWCPWFEKLIYWMVAG